MKMIVGLGNPGTEYSNTRHNVGFRVADSLASSYKKKYKKRKLYHCASLPFDGVIVKPSTYMNLSGKAVLSAMTTYRLDSDSIMVVHDDIYFSLGALKIRQKGSNGGHKGVLSIIESIGTEAFPRLKIGIGSPLSNPVNELDLSEFVLSRFRNSEVETIDKIIEYSCELLRVFLEYGYQNMLEWHSTNKPLNERK